MASVTEILTTMGVGAGQIRRERFTASLGSSSETVVSTYTVEFANSGKKFAASSAESLLVFAESHGIDIPYNCRVGQCGTCATRVLDGEVEMATDEGLDPAQRAQGYRLLCVGVARSNVVLQA
jgi:ferredoxin